MLEIEILSPAVVPCVMCSCSERTVKKQVRVVERDWSGRETATTSAWLCQTCAEAFAEERRQDQ